MTNDEAKELVKVILETFYDGGSVVMPGGLLNDSVWGYHHDGMPATLSIFDSSPHLRITVGLAEQIPGYWTEDLFRMMSKVNDKLLHGRAWADEHGNGLGMFVIMQEIVHLGIVSSNYQPSLDYVVSMVQALPAVAAQWLPELIECCGGRSWSSNLAVLAMSG